MRNAELNNVKMTVGVPGKVDRACSYFPTPQQPQSGMGHGYNGANSVTAAIGANPYRN